MSKRRRSQALPVPQTAQEARALLAEIGALDKAIAGLADQSAQEIAAIKASYDYYIAPLTDTAKEKFLALKSWFEANQDTLPKGRKSIDWPEGQLGYRLSPPALKVAADQEQAVIDRLDLICRDDLFRIKRSIDKPAMIRALREDDRLNSLLEDRVEIVQAHEFFARPIDLDAERSIKVKAPAVKESV